MRTTAPLAAAAIAVLAASPLRAQETPADKPAVKKLAPATAGADGFVLQNDAGD
jgi:hypothetical protein